MKKLFALALLFAACSRREPVHIGSKNFTESVILGELVAQKLERAGCTVDRKLDMGGTFVCDKAIRSGAIDAYVEYSGTAAEAILKKPNVDVAAAYAKDHLHWGPPLGFNNTFAMIVRRDASLSKISDLHRVQNDFQPGFGYEFVERPDGWNGLLRAYGLQFAKPPKTMDLGLTYKALASKQVDLIAGNSTDGLIQSLGLAVLDDDRHYFPRYDAVVVRRDDIDQKCQGAAKALDALQNTINDAAMRQMNFEVDGKKRAVADVAREFLAHVTRNVSKGSGREAAGMPFTAPSAAQIPRYARNDSAVTPSVSEGPGRVGAGGMSATAPPAARIPRYARNDNHARR
jgi:glycine betaine/choline ABC-type transport system substrate-binding protein